MQKSLDEKVGEPEPDVASVERVTVGEIIQRGRGSEAKTMIWRKLGLVGG